MNKITDLVNTLREIREEFQSEYNSADFMRRAETGVLNSDFVRGSVSYQQRQTEIETNFTAATIAAQKRAAERGNDAIDDLRDYELSRISRIDSDTLAKINAISDLPLSSAEIQVLSDRFGTGYWNQRAISDIASKNGVDPQSVGLEPPIDSKMAVLNQLKSQLDEMITKYDTNVKNRESRDARLLFLNDSVLDHAVDIYSSGSAELSKVDTVEKTYATIAAMPGQMQKALLIANSLSNLNGGERDALLYRLAGNTNIQDSVYSVAGCSDEIRQWKSGLAVRYAETAKMSDNLRRMNDVNGIRTIVSSYRDKLRESGAENPFLDDTLATLAKSNSAVAEALGVADTTMDTTATDTTDTEE